VGLCTVETGAEIQFNYGGTLYYVETSRASARNKIIFNLQGMIILPVVLHRCGTWSLTLRGKHGLRAFQNRALRTIFTPKR
jgi:hypothetical protein